jgi:Acetyltransferase (GNAT) family
MPGPSSGGLRLRVSTLRKTARAVSDLRSAGIPAMSSRSPSSEPDKTFPGQPGSAIVVSMVMLRRARSDDSPRLWALNNIPNIGVTADPTVAIDLLIPDGPHPAFPDLTDVEANFVRVGGDFIVVEEDQAIVGMGGFRPRPDARAEVLRVRVHPARRRFGIGRPWWPSSKGAPGPLGSPVCT